MKNNKSSDFNTVDNKEFLRLGANEQETMYLMTYRFLLPFRLPITNGSTFSYKSKYLFKFIHKHYKHPAAEDLAMSHPLKLTFVEATIKIKRNEYKKYPRGEKKRTDKDKIISEKFDVLLEVFNKIIVGLSMRSKNDSIYPVKPMDFLGELAMIIYTYSNKKTEELERNIVNTAFKKKRELENRQIIDFDNYVSAINTLIDNESGNYYEVHKKFRESDRLFFSERYNESIVAYNTAFEMFITNIVLRYEELIKLADESKLYNLSNKTAFGNIVKNNFNPIIQDSLATNNKKLIVEMIKEFRDTCSQYRHSIVHRGESFGLKEAEEVKGFLHDIVLIIIDDIHRVESNNFIDEFKIQYVVTKPNVVDKTIDKYKILIKDDEANKTN